MTNDIEIIQGDCVHELAKLTKERTRADLIFADPPYNIGKEYRGTTDDKREKHTYISWCHVWLSECCFNLQDTGSLWVLINHENAADLEIYIRDQLGMTIQNWITWYETFGNYNKNSCARSSRGLLHATKDPDEFTFNREAILRPSARQTKYKDKRANPAGRIWDDVWGIDPPIPRVCGTHKERIPGYPTQLPLKLLYPIVNLASDPGDLVIDPFSGSGTTLEVCLRTGRRGIGIEINADYMDRSEVRLDLACKELSHAKQESAQAAG